MAIKSNATLDEQDSPYYLENKKTCDEFETFILSKSGQTKGKYNSWSYKATGKIPHEQQWFITIQKSTYTSGNLFLSSEYQSLQFYGKWFAKNFISDCPSFKIFRSKWYDFILTPKAKKISNKKGYAIISKNSGHKLISDLIEAVETLFNLNEVWEISYSNNELIIDYRSKNNYFLTIEKLLKI